MGQAWAQLGDAEGLTSLLILARNAEVKLVRVEALSHLENFLGRSNQSSIGESEDFGKEMRTLEAWCEGPKDLLRREDDSRLCRPGR